MPGALPSVLCTEACQRWQSSLSSCSGGGSVLWLAEAVVQGREPRAGGRLAYHVLEVLLALEQAIADGRRVEINSLPRDSAPDATQARTLFPEHSR